jgi:transcriptional regulator with PAS, ATPase and Fis domain
MRLKEFEKKYSTSSKLEKIELLAENLTWLQEKHKEFTLQKSDECVSFYNSYLEYENNPDPKISKSIARFQLSSLRIISGLDDKQNFEDTIEVTIQNILAMQNSAILAELYAELCFIMLNKRRYQKAVTFGKKAYNLVKEKKMISEIKTFYSNYGMALIYTEKYELAKEVLTLGLAKNKNGDKFISEKLHMHLGLLYRNKQEFQAAISEFLTAQELHDAKDVSGTVILNVNIASIYAYVGDYQKVISILKSNFEIERNNELDASARSNYVGSFNMLIACATAIQNFENAESALKMMRSLIKKYDLSHYDDDYYRLAADVACGKGDYVNAEKIYRQSYEIQKEKGLESSFLKSYINFLVFIHKYEEALPLCEEALDLIDTDENKVEFLELSNDKVKVLKELKRFEEAFFLFEEIYQKEKELKNSELKQQVENLISENEKKEKQLREKEKRISLFNQNLIREHNINFIGTSAAIKDVIDKSTIAAQHPGINVLIVGESGTGKELIAKYIHHASQVDRHIFQEVNCSAIPETMLESEFFGYKKGAFTGAVQDTKGFIEASDKGTLFLDEIGDLPLNLQPKLLKVLEEKRFTPLGSNITRQVSFRLISATNRNLMEMIGNKEFRADLFNRINSLVIEIPPLRKRPADIIPLTDYFLQNFTREFNMVKPDIDAVGRELLLSYSYPGNVRELRNIIERTMIFVRQGESFNEALKTHGFFFSENTQKPKSEKTKYLFSSDSMKLKEVEKQLVQQALELTGNRKSKAANLLGITASGLTRRLQKFAIEA